MSGSSESSPRDADPHHSTHPGLRFVADQHVNGPALRQLRERQVDIVHAAEVGLADADDAALFKWAAREQRIIVTRNYGDYAPLAAAFARRGERCPGVLFLPTSIRPSDVGAHVRALLDWIASAKAHGGNPVENTFGWLR